MLKWGLYCERCTALQSSFSNAGSAFLRWPQLLPWTCQSPRGIPFLIQVRLLVLQMPGLALKQNIWGFKRAMENPSISQPIENIRTQDYPGNSRTFVCINLANLQAKIYFTNMTSCFLLRPVRKGSISTYIFNI